MKKSWFMLLLLLSLIFTVTAFGCSSDDGNEDGDLDQSDGDVETELEDTEDGDEDSVEAEELEESETEVEEEIEAEEEQQFELVFMFLPTTKTGDVLDVTLEVKGGTPPYYEYKVALGDELHRSMNGIELGALPAGIILDSATGKLSGTPTEEGFYHFVISVKDSEDNTTSEHFGIRIGDPEVAGPMALEAEEYQKVYEARHLFNGFSMDAETPDDPDGNLRLTTLGDSTFVTGQCTAAMAYRHAVLKTETSRKTISDLIHGWRFFQRLTGVPGLIGRSFFHKDNPMEDYFYSEWQVQQDAIANGENPEIRWIQGEGDEFKDFYWRADTSRDQISGPLWGVSMAYDLLDNAEDKEVAAEFLAALADHIWDHDLKIVDPDGEMTEYGLMDGNLFQGLPVPDGLNSVVCLALFKAAHHATGEERFANYYNTLLIDEGYLENIKSSFYEWTYSGYWDIKWYNTYITWENWFTLMRLEQDPELREQMKVAMRDNIWLVTEDTTTNRRGILEDNAVKTPWYLYSTGYKDSEALYKAVEQVSIFPKAPLRDHSVHNSDDPTIEKNMNPKTFDDNDQPTEALYALPIDKRREDMVRWHRSPYVLDGGNNSGRERTGCDYMLPYWMGRYYGYINAEW